MNNAEILNKLLSNISKGLSIANKVIPIYQDSKPLFKNVKNIYSIFKNNNINNDKPIVDKNVESINIKRDNNPQFFI